MKNILPISLLGKLSTVSAIVMPILFFVGTSFTNTLYESVPAGNTFIEDLANRPALSITMSVAELFGILAFIFGLIAILKKKEKSPLVYIATVIGGLMVFMLIGELLFPH